MVRGGVLIKHFLRGNLNGEGAEAVKLQRAQLPLCFLVAGLFVKHQNLGGGKIQSKIRWSTNDVSLQPLLSRAAVASKGEAAEAWRDVKCFLHFSSVCSGLEDFVHQLVIIQVNTVAFTPHLL